MSQSTPQDISLDTNFRPMNSNGDLLSPIIAPDSDSPPFVDNLSPSNSSAKLTISLTNDHGEEVLEVNIVPPSPVFNPATDDLDSQMESLSLSQETREFGFRQGKGDWDGITFHSRITGNWGMICSH